MNTLIVTGGPIVLIINKSDKAKLMTNMLVWKKREMEGNNRFSLLHAGTVLLNGVTYWSPETFDLHEDVDDQTIANK